MQRYLNSSAAKACVESQASKYKRGDCQRGKYKSDVIGRQGFNETWVDDGLSSFIKREPVFFLVCLGCGERG